jgi:hypothetical protein
MKLRFTPRAIAIINFAEKNCRGANRTLNYAKRRPSGAILGKLAPAVRCSLVGAQEQQFGLLWHGTLLICEALAQAGTNIHGGAPVEEVA